ncbi:MAG: RHS repeat-associated core domain-containing protein, partial [Pseudomonadota bacterium]
MTQSFTQSVTAGPSNVYVISQGWGPTSAATLAHYQRRLAQARATNAAPGSEAVMGPAVAVLSAQWLAQVSASFGILDRVAGSWTLWFNAVGIAGYSGSTMYVDLPGNQTTIVTADRSSFYPQFLAGGFPMSVLESASVQQVSGVADAASTVSLIDKAVAGGVRVFNAVSANYGTVRPLLVAGPGCSPYAASFDSAVNGGRRLVVPAKCDLAADQWRGAGWFATFFNGSSGSVTAAINGGNPANLTPPAFTPPSPVFNGALSAAPGDFTMATTDISVGAGEFPYALSLERRYSSGSSLEDGVFGRGWSHNLGGSARTSEAGLRALGAGSALDAVANIVSNMVALDLMTEANQPLVNVVAATVGSKWASEQLEDTAVTVRLGTSTEVFMRLPDGTYNPPRGSSARLTLVGGTFRYETKDRTVLNFNAAGELVDYTLSNGVRARFGYTGGRLTSVSNSLGRSITLAINGTTQRIDSATAKGSAADPGRTVSYGYTGNTLTRFTNAMGAFGSASAQNTTYAYDGSTRLCRMFRPLEPTVPALTNNYDALGRLSVQVGDAAAGRVTRYFHAGSRTEVETPGAGTVNYTDCAGAAASVAVTGNAVRTVSFRNWQGLPVRVVDPMIRATSTVYDGAGRPTRVTMNEGNRVEYTYDDATCSSAERRCTHNVLTEVRHPKPGSPLAPLTTTYTYEASFNKVASVTNPRGQRTDYTWHAGHGSPATVTLPAPAAGAERPQTSMTYAAQTPTGWPNFQLLSSETRRITGAANTTTTTWTYNAANGWVPAEMVVDSGTGKLALTTAYTHDLVGNLTVVNGPRTDVTDTVTTAYDNLRRVTQVTDALGKVSRTFYDVNGRAVRSARQLGTGWMVSCTRYSRSDQPTRAWGPLRMAADTACPAEAHPVPITDRTYDKLGRLATEAVALTTAEGGSRTTAYVYFADGQVQDVTSGSGTAVASTDRYTYTLNGLRATLRDGQGNLSTWVYDGFDRVSRLSYPSTTVGAGTSSATDFEAYTYDANGNRATHRLRNNITVTLGYDNLDRLTGRTYPNPADSVTYTYDLLGRTLSANQSGHAISSVWDNAGRLTSTTAGGRTLSYQYDSAGNRTRMTWPDGFFTTTGYDALNRPTSIRENNGTVNLVTSYAYDDLSRRATVTLGNGTTSTYTWGDQGMMGTLLHDLAGTATDVTYTLGRNQAREVTSRTISNAAYNWLPPASPNRTYTPNGLNQYTAARGATLAHDPRGNLSGDGTWTWGYNDLNQLVSASRTGTSVALTYDGTGRLRQEVANGTTTAFLYDGGDRVAEYNGAGALLRRHVHGPGIDEPIVSYEGAGTTSKTWLYADPQGSIVASANSAGTSTQSQGYGPFGEPGSTTGTRFKYTGQAYVESLGLHYYKARFYSHTLGRFLQTDPVG